MSFNHPPTSQHMTNRVRSRISKDKAYYGKLLDYRDLTPFYFRSMNTRAFDRCCIRPVPCSIGTRYSCEITSSKTPCNTTSRQARRLVSLPATYSLSICNKHSIELASSLCSSQYASLSTTRLGRAPCGSGASTLSVHHRICEPEYQDGSNPSSPTRNKEAGQ
jgi:hypothetical protein